MSSRGNLGARLAPAVRAQIDQTLGCNHLLDVGCGNGALAHRLAPYFKSTTAIDLEAEPLLPAAQLPEAIRFLQGDFQSMPFPQGQQFDLIVAAFSVHHMDLPAIFEKMKRLLAPNGKVVILDLFADEKRTIGRYLIDQLLRSYVSFHGVPSDRKVSLPLRLHFLFWIDRLQFLSKPVGMAHIREDLAMDRPPSLAEWQDVFDRYLPGGGLSIATGATLMYSWRRHELPGE